MKKCKLCSRWLVAIRVLGLAARWRVRLTFSRHEHGPFLNAKRLSKLIIMSLMGVVRLSSSSNATRLAAAAAASCLGCTKRQVLTNDQNRNWREDFASIVDNGG